jgi:hypothetical protein
MSKETTKLWRENFKKEDPVGYRKYKREAQIRYRARQKDKEYQKARDWKRDHYKEFRAHKRKFYESRKWPHNYSSKIKSKFGITFEERTKMLENQGNRCAICGTTNPPFNQGRRDGWCIDHCHAYENRTGGIKIRGILCIACNGMLGLAKDNIQTLISAISYLQKHQDLLGN